MSNSKLSKETPLIQIYLLIFQPNASISAHSHYTKKIKIFKEKNIFFYVTNYDSIILGMVQIWIYKLRWNVIDTKRTEHGYISAAASSWIWQNSIEF